jgi:hypothetical protein
MEGKSHPLAAHQKRALKDQHRDVLDDIDLLSHQYNVAMGTKRTVYTCDGLHVKPHLGANSEDKNFYDKELKKANVTIIDIPETQVEYHDEVLHLGRKESEMMNMLFEGIADPDESEFVLFKQLHDRIEDEAAKKKKSASRNKGKKKKKSTKKDARIGVESQTTKMSVGFCQGMRNSDKYVAEKGPRKGETTDIKIPYPYAGTKEMMLWPSEPKDFVAKLLHNGDKVLRKVDGNAMTNEERSKLVKEHFVKDLFGESTDSSYEYINISLREVTKINTLQKHFDSKNDSRDSYGQSLVYSYFVNHDNKVFKVTIVMTFRSAIGSIMDKIKKVEE